MSNHINYTIRDSEIETIDQFLNQFGLSIVRSMTRQELLDYSDDNGVSNLDKIWLNYNASQKIKYAVEYNLRDLNVVNFNTTLSLPKNRLFLETAGVIGKNQIVDQNNVNGFLAESLKNLLKDNSYRRDVSTNLTNKVSLIHNNLSVWIWCKALSDIDNDLSEKLINITPFITSINTNVDDNGGNFQIQIAPVECFYQNDTWNIDLAPKQNFLSQQNTVIDSKLNTFLLHTILTSNDVVFIRYEKLESEDNELTNSLLIHKSQLPSIQNNSRIYDMIGLIDNCSLSANSETNDIQSTIIGRDLMKLLIDDGSYFYPLQFAQGVFINPNENDKLIKRLAVDGQFILQSSYAFRSISYTLQFILNHLANIRICPDDLFVFYGDRRSLVYRIDQQSSRINNDEKQSIKANIFDEIYQITGNNDELYQQQILDYIINLLQTAESESKLIFNQGSFNGYNTFSLAETNTTPQFLKDQNISLFSVITNTIIIAGVQQADINTKPQLLLEYCYEYYKFNNLDQTNIETQAKGIWQIVKLVIDESVSDRRVADSSISQPDGSIINQFWKVCQRPFVEFYGDTYGDTYNLIVRKPPFDKSSILSFIDDDVVIDILTENTLEINVQFNGDDIYTFFEIIPQGLFAGQGSEVSLAYIPIVYFPQYADIWGTKRLSVVSNYLSYKGLIGESEQQDVNFLVEQSALDLKYLIDTHCYLPFTRKGTITINGDRRIKKGTWIYLELTDEIYYVDSVNNSASIQGATLDRTTTLTVSRGMKKEYLTGPTSYFNIVDSEVIYEYVVSSLTQNNQTTESLSKKIKRNFGVNQQVFNFFLKKRQFS